MKKPTRLPCPWNFPGKNTGEDCHFLLQFILEFSINSTLCLSLLQIPENPSDLLCFLAQVARLPIPWPGQLWMQPKLATFPVSWYMDQNNSPSVEYAFSRPSEMPARHSAFFFEVRRRRYSIFFFILRGGPGMLPDHWTSNSLLMLQTSYLYSPECYVYY